MGIASVCDFTISSRKLFSGLQAESCQNPYLEWAVVFNKPCVTCRSASFDSKRQLERAKKSKTERRDV